MITQEEIKDFEISKANAEVAIEKGEQLKRLLASPEYIALISEGFFKTYPAEIGKAVANNTGAYDAAILFKQLEGINTLKGYEFQIANNALAAAQDLLDIEGYIANSVRDEE